MAGYILLNFRQGADAQSRTRRGKPTATLRIDHILLTAEVKAEGRLSPEQPSSITHSKSSSVSSLSSLKDSERMNGLKI